MRRKMTILAVGAAALAMTSAGWFAYREFFTDGLAQLPAEVCDGSVRRETVVRVLPDVRTAEEGAEIHGAGSNFMFACHVYAGDDSILSGEVKILDSSREDWASFYQSYGGKSAESGNQASLEGIYAMSRNDFASVYVPCTPQGSKETEASHAYALIAEARITGESRLTGTAMRQAVADFAYELTRHAYTLGECQKPRKFPSQLPRFADD
ncbi:hypothetical protein RKD49_005032 [Streptomyces glaucescens]